MNFLVRKLYLNKPTKIFRNRINIIKLKGKLGMHFYIKISIHNCRVSTTSQMLKAHESTLLYC